MYIFILLPTIQHTFSRPQVRSKNVVTDKRAKFICKDIQIYCPTVVRARVFPCLSFSVDFVFFHVILSYCVFMLADSSVFALHDGGTRGALLKFCRWQQHILHSLLLQFVSFSSSSSFSSAYWSDLSKFLQSPTGRLKPDTVGHCCS